MKQILVNLFAAVAFFFPAFTLGKIFSWDKATRMIATALIIALFVMHLTPTVIFLVIGYTLGCIAMKENDLKPAGWFMMYFFAILSQLLQLTI